jgi:hypothetical protein
MGDENRNTRSSMRWMLAGVLLAALGAFVFWAQPDPVGPDSTASPVIPVDTKQVHSASARRAAPPETPVVDTSEKALPSASPEESAAVAAEQPETLMAPFTLEDQHGKEHTLDASVRAILYSRDRTGGFVMTRSMEGRDGNFLPERGVLYINDISTMPTYAATLFALPKMRRRSYLILLDRTSEVTASFPDQDRKASLIHLEDMEISKVEYFADSDMLAERMEKMPKGD